MLWPQGFWQHRGQSQRDISCLTLSFFPSFPPLPSPLYPHLCFSLTLPFPRRSLSLSLPVDELSLDPDVFQTFFHTWLTSEVPFFSVLSFSIHLSSMVRIDLLTPFLMQQQSAGLPFPFPATSWTSNQEVLCICILAVKENGEMSHHCVRIFYRNQELIWHKCNLYEVSEKRMMAGETERDELFTVLTGWEAMIRQGREQKEREGTRGHGVRWKERGRRGNVERKWKRGCKKDRQKEGRGMAMKQPSRSDTACKMSFF